MPTTKPPRRRRKAAIDRKIVRTFTANQRDLAMLEAVARYHGFSKSATLVSLVRKEFWRVFPAGNDLVQPDPHARIAPEAAPSARATAPRPDD